MTVSAPKGGEMKIATGTLLACLFLVAVAAVSGPAQAKSKSDIRTITGCLSKGASAKEFMLAGNDGSTWEVRSSRVALADHVGHTVSATGVVFNAAMHNMKEDTKDMAKDSGMKKDNSEHGHMKITDIKWSAILARSSVGFRVQTGFASGDSSSSCAAFLWLPSGAQPWRVSETYRKGDSAASPRKKSISLRSRD
jgi:hypothetical protein